MADQVQKSQRSNVKSHVIASPRHAFTLVEIMIAVAIFAVVSTAIGTLYVQAFQEKKRANLRNQVYNDGRFIMAQLAAEISANTVDYDEYYNQHVVIPTLAARPGLIPDAVNIHNYGQNYGRYFSSFFNPGSDEALGFDCNTLTAADGEIGTVPRDAKRNRRNCTPVRPTIDRYTGQNPFSGKYETAVFDRESAFCGTVGYDLPSAPANEGICAATPAREPDDAASRNRSRLYLISGNGSQKTILARERIGGTDSSPMYSLSLLRLNGIDVNGDNVMDKFYCAPGFNCRGTYRVEAGAAVVVDGDCGEGPIYGQTPRDGDADLTEAQTSACDKKEDGFAKDFVPITPFRANIKDVKFYISPLENPVYAFSESDQQKSPRVTIVLTVENNPEYTWPFGQSQPITLVKTVSTRASPRVPAPLLIRPSS